MTRIFELFLLLMSSPVIVLSLKRNVNIGIFLNENDSEMDEIVIKSSMNIINQIYNFDFILNPVIYRLKATDLTNARQGVCNMLENRVVAVFGPESINNNEIIQSTCLNYEIPQFQITPNPNLAIFSTLAKSDMEIGTFNFNLHPPSYNLSRALATLVRDNDWMSYTVIYENDDGLVRLEEVLKAQDPNNPAATFIKLGNKGDHRSILKEIKASGAVHIILDCETDHIIDILLQAREFKLLEEYYSYILTSLDLHTLDFSLFHGIKANITAFRIHTTQNKLNKVIQNWEMLGNAHIPSNRVKTKTVLLFDAINVFITTFSKLDKKENFAIKSLNCDEYNDISAHGNKLAHYIVKNNITKGLLSESFLSGPITFDSSGQRLSFQLELIEYFKSEFRKTAIWNSDTPNKINSLLSTKERQEEIFKHIKGRTFCVVSREGPPYFIVKRSDSDKPLQGNDRFEGHSVDLIAGICEILGCNYSFEKVPDNHYGKYDENTKTWDGLIGHLLARKADLAVCDLTITHERRKVVDFTNPYMSLGISILYTKAVKEPPELLAFTHPLSLDVWLYMATTFLIITLIIFLTARLNPHDWENPHPCNPCPEELENIWDIKNCFWLTLGSIMAQGCDILPKGISTRVVAAMWWIFSLIMTAAYTANLAAFLTMERMGPTIESAEDLAMQNKIKYGCLYGASTYSFFKNSNISLYHRMFIEMESADPSVFQIGNNEGVKRVITSKSKYAFFMESSSIEYETQKSCDLVQVGSWLDTKGYGIAMPPNAYYRSAFSEAVVKMEETGQLKRLKEKWWIEKNSHQDCKEDKKSSQIETSELGLPHVGGVFVVLAVGMGIALTFAIFEFLWNVRKVAVSQRMTLKQAFFKELKFALNIRAHKKRVTPITNKDITRKDTIDDKFKENH